MFYCPECKSFFEDLEVKYDPECGYDSVCPECGSGYWEEAVKCPECGEWHEDDCEELCRDCRMEAHDLFVSFLEQFKMDSRDAVLDIVSDIMEAM